MKKLIIASMNMGEKECLATVLLEEQKPLEIRLTPKKMDPILGNIYIGKVEKIQRNIDAAFVLIAPGQSCYLSLKDVEEEGQTLKAGDQILVQVEKEAIKQKLPRLTTNLTLAGKYLVLSSRRQTMNFSHKLQPEEKLRLKACLKSRRSPDFGLVVRTNAREAPEEDLLEELEALTRQMNHICRYAQARTCFSCLHRSPGPWVQELIDQSFQSLQRILTDQEEVYEELKQYLLLHDPEGQVSLEYYQDPLLPLSHLCNLYGLVDKLSKERVWLSSGGFLVIQETEAFVAIDVNTGKCMDKTNSQETFYRINREAAEEIALQLRLRQLSGIILIDFINMSDPRQQKELKEYMQELVDRDSVQTKVVDITPLHIMELTRRKEKKSFRDQIRSLTSNGLHDKLV